MVSLERSWTSGLERDFLEGETFYCQRSLKHRKVSLVFAYEKCCGWKDIKIQCKREPKQTPQNYSIKILHRSMFFKWKRPISSLMQAELLKPLGMNVVKQGKLNLMKKKRNVSSPNVYLLGGGRRFARCRLRYQFHSDAALAEQTLELCWR